MRRLVERPQFRPHSAVSDRRGRLSVQTTSSDALLQFASLVGNRTFTRMLQRDSSPPVAPALLVDDDAEVLGPGQVRKSEFLAYLRAAVVEVAGEVLAPAGLSPATCPYIPAWFGHYTGKDAGHVERAIQLYAPGATTEGDWRGAASHVVDRVREALKAYVATGSLAGVPAEVAKTPVTGPGGHPVNPTVQRCGLKEPKVKAGKGDGPRREPDVDFEAMYKAGDAWVGKQYAVRRLPGDHPSNPFREPVVVKMCPDHEQQLTKKLSGHANFPRYLASGGVYLVTAHIGDYDAEPLRAVEGLDTGDLDQLVEIVRILTEANVAHEDMDNNILKDGEHLYCIDLNCLNRGSAQRNLENTLEHATRLLRPAQKKTLRERCAGFADT